MCTWLNAIFCFHWLTLNLSEQLITWIFFSVMTIYCHFIDLFCQSYSVIRQLVKEFVLTNNFYLSLFLIFSKCKFRHLFHKLKINLSISKKKTMKNQVKLITKFTWESCENVMSSLFLKSVKLKNSNKLALQRKTIFIIKSNFFKMNRYFVNNFK